MCLRRFASFLCAVPGFTALLLYPRKAQASISTVSAASALTSALDNFLRLKALGPDYRDSARAGAMRVLSHTLTDHLYLSIAQRSSMLAMLSLEPLDHQPQAITTRPSICQALAYSCTVGAGQAPSVIAPTRITIKGPSQSPPPNRAHFTHRGIIIGALRLTASVTAQLLSPARRSPSHAHSSHHTPTASSFASAHPLADPITSQRQRHVASQRTPSSPFNVCAHWPPRCP